MSLKHAQLDRFPRGGADAWDEPQASVPLTRDWLTPSIGPALKRWNGSAWTGEPLKHWNGVAQEHYGVLKRWNGSTWVAAAGISTPPPPYVAPAPLPSLTIALDGYTSGLWGAYSVRRRLRTGYSGPLFQVVRSTDSATLDIGIVSDRADTNALYAFLGAAARGTISTLYDQSGNGNHFTQATAANRALSDFGVSSEGVAKFDGVNDGMVGPAFGGTFSGATFFVRGRLPTTADQALLESSINYDNNADTLLIYHAVAEGGTSVATHGSGSAYARSSYGDVRPNGDVHAYRIDRSAAAFVDKTSLFVAGTKQTRTGNADIGTITGNFASNVLYLGGRNGGASIPARLDQFDLCIYSTALSDADVGTISARLAA